MKKLNLIFRLSFIMYIFSLVAIPYFTAQLWADLIIFLFIAAVLYQIIYLFILRKKDNERFFDILILFIICGMTSVSFFIIIDYIDIFINGYSATDLVGNSLGKVYYGMEAILKAAWKNLFYIPYMIVNLIIVIVYSYFEKRKNKTELNNKN